MGWRGVPEPGMSRCRRGTETVGQMWIDGREEGSVRVEETVEAGSGETAGCWEVFKVVPHEVGPARTATRRAGVAVGARHREGDAR